MWRVACWLAFVTIGFAIATESVRGQSQPASEAWSSPLLTSNPILQASLNRIAQGSASWREALEQVARTGRRALVITPDQVQVKVVDRRGKARPFDPSVLAQVVPVLRDGSRIGTVLVVINLRLIDELHNARLSVPLHFEADIDRILVHEIYGHALPYLVAGDLSGRCADPERGARAAEACSIRRENVVRAELGFGRRTDYGLSDLVLTRRAAF
jgi:hypothetical protein